MNLSHYTARDKPLVLQKSYGYSRHKLEREANCMKPTGLWVSVDGENDWPNWCKRNAWQPGIHAMARRYKIFLREEHDVLIIDTELMLLDFTKRYLVKPPHTDRLDWHAIKCGWRGLIISPFQFNLHIHCECSWYYGWDCESGCIWNMDAIERCEEDLSWRR